MMNEKLDIRYRVRSLHRLKTLIRAEQVEKLLFIIFEYQPFYKEADKSCKLSFEKYTQKNTPAKLHWMIAATILLLLRRIKGKNAAACLLIGLIFTSTNPTIGQVPVFSKVPNLYPDDSLNITRLVQQGTKISKLKAICWFPADSLSDQRMNEIADTINIGIIAAEKLIHAPLPWQVHPFNEPYTFYFRTDSFISHASGAGFVSIPFWRIKNGKAPWLHEAMHEMLNASGDNWQDTTLVTEEEWEKNMPLWLYEGLPDYLSITVSRTNHLQWYDVFSRSSQMNVDSMFKENMKTRNDTASYILSHIGVKGAMPELFSAGRSSFAPGFYHGSCSFVQYIAEHYGLNILLSGIASFQKEEETIEKLSGKPVTTLKQEWLDKLNITQ